MDTISLQVTIDSAQQEGASTVRKGSLRVKGLVLPAIAIIMWMAVGSCIAWLISDFNRSLAPDTSVIPPSVIFFLFLAFALVTWQFSWNSSRKASANKPSAKLPKN
jgi:hypothetical protein